MKKPCALNSPATAINKRARASARKRDIVEQGCDDVVGILAVGFGGKREQQTMSQYWRRECLDVLAGDSQAAIKQRACF